MVITHNMLAVNAQRQFGIVNRNQAKTSEKLSSGYRINRAADDAAGLSISEKMRSQIRGLTQASTNAQEGISFVQVADGALNEVHSMLQRMNELCIKASNGTNTSADRDAVQKEMDQLVDEIDRIGKSTEYNTKLIFTEGLRLTDKQDRSVTGLKMLNSISSDTLDKLMNGNPHVMKADETGVWMDDTAATAWSSIPYADVGGDRTYVYTNDAYDLQYTFKVPVGASIDELIDQVNNTEFQVNIADKVIIGDGVGCPTHPSFSYGVRMKRGLENEIMGSDVSLNFYRSLGIDNLDKFHTENLGAAIFRAGNQIGIRYNYMGHATDYMISEDAMNQYRNIDVSGNQSEYIKFEGDAGSVSLYLDFGVTGGAQKLSDLLNGMVGDSFTQGSSSSVVICAPRGHIDTWIQAGARDGIGLSIRIDEMSAASLNIRGIKTDTISHALGSIDKVAKAIRDISASRSRIGASQNRLEHTIRNLDNVVENLSAAESQIRDTAIDDAMVEYSKNNILIQAGQSMMAQANQQTGGVLSLLQ